MAAMVAKGNIIKFLNLTVTLISLSKLSFNLTYGLGGEMKIFQNDCHGGHLGYWNIKILAFLNLIVSMMPPMRFQPDPANSSGRDVKV